MLQATFIFEGGSQGEGIAWGVELPNEIPRRAPSFDNVVVKSHKGLLLTKVTKHDKIETERW